MLKRILLAIVLSIASCGVYAYDFSAVAPTGQTLYYQTMSGFKAKVTYPYTSSNNWGGIPNPQETSLFQIALLIPAIHIWSLQLTIMLFMDVTI